MGFFCDARFGHPHFVDRFAHAADDNPRLSVRHALVENKSLQRALVAGGIFGLMLLLRTQSMIILPVVLLLAMFVFWPQWGAAGRMVAVFLIGIAVTVAPWLIHNDLAIGKFTLMIPNSWR